MAKQIAIDFTVEGQGDFPFDMLRYDRCFPTDPESAANLQTPGPKSPQQRKCTLRIITDNKALRPTRDRWTSFGWTVGAVVVNSF
jgi:hypothetical protein